MNVLSVESLLSELEQLHFKVQRLERERLEAVRENSKLTAQRDFFLSDSGAAWDRCEERRLENEKLKSALREAKSAIAKLINDTPSLAIPCNGNKCREAWCYSCNSEDDADNAILEIHADCDDGMKAITTINKVLGDA